MGDAIKNYFQTMLSEWKSYDGRERAFMFFAMLCGFFICCEYSLIRPISNSLFLANFSAKWLPYAWICLVPFNFLLVSLYNRLIPKWGSRRLFVWLILTVIGCNATIAVFAEKLRWIPFAFYMWKEIYVLLMFQLVWSVIHANVQMKRAKYLYGIFYGIGGLGSMLGAVIPSFFAVTFGTGHLIFLSLPVYGMLLFVYAKMSHYCRGDVPHHEREEKGGFTHGIRLISGSRFLIFALLIVVFMQTIAAISDFQFNDFLARFQPDTDLRTEYCARVLGIVHTVTVVLQFLGTYLLIRFIGFKNVHHLVPICLAFFAGLLVVFPVFPIVSLMFIACKSIDFSVFGVIKEMLYVPLKPDEKFRAKAVIDVFAYRSSKAFASFLIIFATSLFSSQVLTWVNIALAAAWVFSVSYGLKDYKYAQEMNEA